MKREDLCLTGSGRLTTYEIEAKDFDAVSIIGPVNLRYTQRSDTKVTVDAEPEMFQHLDYHVSQGILYIGYNENIRCFETIHDVWVNITHPELSDIEADGVNEIVTSSPITQSSINIDASGNVELSLTGKVQTQTLSASGTLKARNFGLIAKQTYVDISGFGELQINCAETLDIDVSGSSTVYYKGQPIINKNVDGTLSLEDAN